MNQTHLNCAFEKLADLKHNRKEHVQQYDDTALISSSEDRNDLEHPILDSCYNAQTGTAIPNPTKVSYRQFYRQYSRFENKITAQRIVGREKNRSNVHSSVVCNARAAQTRMLLGFYD